MTFSKSTQFLVVAGLATTLSGCFNSSSYTPILEFASPFGAPSPFVAVETGTTKLLVSGEFLSNDTVVYWNGRPQPTRFLGNVNAGTAGEPAIGSLEVDLDPEATKVPGTIELTAMGEGTLMSKPFRLTIGDAAFTLTAGAPLQIPLGAPDTTLALAGTGFNPSAQVSWEGTALQTTFRSSTSVTALVPAALLTTIGSQLVRISEQSCFSGLCKAVAETIAVDVGSHTLKVVQPVESTPHGLIWDPAHALLYAGMSSRAATGGVSTSIMAIDPATGGFGATAAVSVGAGALSISDGAQFLYVGDSRPPVRFTLPALTEQTTFPGLSEGTALVPAPGAVDTVAFIDLFGDNVGVIDGTVPRANTAQTFSLRSVTWGFDSTILYGISDFDPGVQVFNVDPSGVTKGPALGTTRFAANKTVTFDRTTRRIYGSSGENVDEQGGDPRPFALGQAGLGTSCMAAIDSILGKAFFACVEQGIGLTVRSFDLETQRPLGRFVMVMDEFGSVPSPSGFVRWGTDGLAISAVGNGFRTSDTLFLYSGQFVR